MIFNNERPISRPTPPGGCPPCTQRCNQGRECPNLATRHPPPDRSTAGGLDQADGEDGDGLGFFRGLLVASALTFAAWVLVLLAYWMPELIGMAAP